MEDYRVIHKHSLLGNEMIPVNDELDYGEIAIDYHGGSEALYIKNDNDEIVSFTPSTDHPVFEEGSGPNSVQQKYTGAAAHGAASVAEGSNTIAENDYEHAEGVYNMSNTGSTASAQTISSVGIGDSSQRKNAIEVMQNGDVYIKGIGIYNGTNAGASGVQDVLEFTVSRINWAENTFLAKADVVVDEGDGTNSVVQANTGAVASGTASIAVGSNTVANNDYEHAEGVYNLSNTGSTASAQTISSVGIGTSSQRKNALEVMQNGDVYMLGVGGYDGTNAGGQDVKTVKDYFQFLINWVNLTFALKPVVVWETDGTTGLLGLNESSFGSDNWQLENLNLSGFSFIRCYFKASASDASQPSGAMVIDIPLDNAASVGSSYAYFGSALQLHPFNRNRQIGMGCAVDLTKTKFKVVYQITLWDISVSNANSESDARYLYKIVGYYE